MQPLLYFFLQCMGIPMIKIRLSWDYLIHIMGIPMLESIYWDSPQISVNCDLKYNQIQPKSFTECGEGISQCILHPSTYTALTWTWNSWNLSLEDCSVTWKLLHVLKYRNLIWIITNWSNIIWVRSRNCGCLVNWFFYQLIAKPANKTRRSFVTWPICWINL